MAVRKDWAPLAGILQKALESISEKERNDVYRKWLPVRYEHRFNYTLLWQSRAVFGVVSLALLVWNRKLARVIDLNKTVDGMLTMLRRFIGEDINLSWLPGKNVAQVYMPPSQLEQILANLFVNAGMP